MRYNIDGENDSWEFDGWNEAIEFACNRKHAETYPQIASSRNTDRPEFSQTNTFEEGVDLALNGWREGADSARKYQGKMLARLQGVVAKPLRVRDVEGRYFEIGELCAGEPEHWRKYQKNRTRNMTLVKGDTIVTVLVNMSISCNIRPSVIMRRGAAIAALVSLLESAGKHVKIYAYGSAYGNDGHSSIKILIKRPDKPMDLDRIAFAVGHPAMLRRVLFSIWESSDLFMKHFGWSYGKPRDAEKSEIGRAIHIPRMCWDEPQWHSDEDAEKWICEKLAQQGVKLTRRVAA